MPSEHLGLRDRKREETRSRLEAAAVSLVLQDGIDHTTVDSISAIADVSSRTFFNYFDTKEDAILGIRDIELTPEVVAEHLARTDGADVVESTVTLLLGLISPSIEGASLHDSRHEILRRHPELFGRHIVQMTRMIDQLTQATHTILDHDDAPRSAGSSPSDPVAAELLLSLCAGAVRATVKRWIADGATDHVDALAPRATAHVRSLLERLS